MTIKDMPHVTVEQVLALREAAIEMEQERDELAAQVERLRSAAKNIVKHRQPDGQYIVLTTYIKKLELVLSETPPAALTALKAQWQAEVLRQRAQEASNESTHS